MSCYVLLILLYSRIKLEIFLHVLWSIFVEVIGKLKHSVLWQTVWKLCRFIIKFCIIKTLFYVVTFEGEWRHELGRMWAVEIKTCFLKVPKFVCFHWIFVFLSLSLTLYLLMYGSFAWKVLQLISSHVKFTCYPFTLIWDILCHTSQHC